MANLSETATYDAGVYQLETTDAVQGGAAGVSNSPLKNLANRTAYLKQRVDGIEAGTTDLPGYAKLNSPAFTGSPTAPTQALGDNSTKIANTAFVQATIGGRLVKSVAGSANVTLTAVEAGNAILELTGALTGNIAVIVPTSPTRSWIVKNATSGAYTITVKSAAGTGVVVTQGTNAVVWTDGTNVYDALTDFDSPALTGTPTAPTPAQFDNDTSLATTEFVQRALGNTKGYNTYAANTTIAAAAAGSWNAPTAPGLTLTLPLVSSVAAGSVLHFYGNSQGVTISRQGADNIVMGSSSPNSFALGINDRISLIAIVSGWYAFGGEACMGQSSSFGSSLAASGYQKLPSGLIIQWGILPAISANSSANITYPIAFPNGFMSFAGTPGADSAADRTLAGFNALGTGNSKAGCTVWNTSASLSTQIGTYVALGY